MGKIIKMGNDEFILYVRKQNSTCKYDTSKLPILGCPLLDGHQQAPVKKRVHKFNDYYLHIVMGRRFS